MRTSNVSAIVFLRSSSVISAPVRRGGRGLPSLRLYGHTCIPASNLHLRRVDRKSKTISFRLLQRTFPASPCAPRQAARAGYPRALSSAGLLARAARRTRGRGGGGGGGGREP